MTGRRVLVTGAGGFVGGHLARGFADLGAEVHGLDRGFDDTTATRLDGVRLVVADLERGVPSEVPSADLVVHAAAITTDPGALGWRPSVHVAANLRLLESALAYAAARRPSAFVFLSSSGVFAPDDGQVMLRDTDTPTGGSAYALAKQIGEAWTRDALADVAAAHVVRLGYVFGPAETARPTRQRVSLVAEWLAAAEQGRSLLVREDDPARDWTYAPDLAPALARLVDGTAGVRPVHLASGQVLHDSALAALIAARFPGLEIDTVPAPGQAKPPMAASACVAAVRDTRWTPIEAALERLTAREVPA